MSPTASGGSGASPEPAPAGARLPPGRRALYGLLTLLLFAALLEGALAAAGLGDSRGRLSLSRGFSPSARYLVRDTDRPGWWRTQMNGGEAPEIEVPPRGAAVRVVMVGGSNVAGFRTDHLDQALDRALPDPGFEVVNLGRAGYGSERELILLRQALAALEPDIALVYVGHNEFVEGGFALELSQGGWAPLATRVADSLLGLRSVCATVDLMTARAAGTGSPMLPEERRKRSAVFRDMTPERAAVFYDVFRRNLQAMLDSCREAGVRVLLATVVSNLFDPPYVSNPPADWDDDRRRALARARAEMHALMPARIRDGLVVTGPDRPGPHLRPDDWGSNLPPDSLQARRARAGSRPEPPSLRPHTGRLGDAPFWSDPAVWSDKVFDLLSIFEQVHERRLTDDERAALRRATEAGERALLLCPDDPDTLYGLGLCVYLLGEDDERAAELLRAAAAADRAPTKGNDRINGILRELAAAHAGDEGIRFLDLDELFRSRCPQGLPGYEVLLDNCHLHPAARLVLVEDFVPDLVELGRGVLPGR